MRGCAARRDGVLRAAHGRRRGARRGRRHDRARSTERRRVRRGARDGELGEQQTYLVEVRVDGRPLRRTIVLARGDDGHVDFDLIVHPTGAVSAVLAFTLGGVALVVGGISGADALARGAAIKTRCPGGHCPAGEEQAVSSARGIATCRRARSWSPARRRRST